MRLVVTVLTLWWWASSGIFGRAQPIPLECRLVPGNWQACQMDIKTTGHHWFLVVAGERIEFQHDGSGRMRKGRNGVWQDVTPRWSEDGSLCWDDVCVRGTIPLD
jgi:hypothetical protein